VGVGRDLVESRFGAPCLFLQGCAGDQGTGRWIEGTPASDTRAMGERLAAGVGRAMERLAERPVANVHVATERVALDLDAFPPLSMLERDLRAAAAAVDPGPIVALGDALVVARRADELRTARLTAISLGDVALAILPGEVFVEHGLAIRAGSPFPETVVAAYDDNTLQYIPTHAAFADGEYEVDGGWRYIRPGQGERMVGAMIALLARLRAAPA
jgi:neutral ceramidase